MGTPRRIPYDSLVLAACLAECRAYVGRVVDRVTQPDQLTLCLGTGRGQNIILSCDPTYFRLHAASKPGLSMKPLPGFGMTVRTKLDGALISAIGQVGFDRIGSIEFETESGRIVLVAELMGKHSNLMLLNPSDRILAVAKPIGATKSKRVVLAGRPYEPPPFPPRRSLLDANDDEPLSELEGASPFLLSLMEASGLKVSELKRLIAARRFGAFVVPEAGVYPLDPTPLGYRAIPKSSMGMALEQHVDQSSTQNRLLHARQSLLGQLRRVALARETAIQDLGNVLDTASRSARLQLMGELILAYQSQIAPGATVLESEDYEGMPIQVPLLEDLTALENANRYFGKAKRAKAGAEGARERHELLTRELQDVIDLITELEAAESLDSVSQVEQEARRRKWLHSQPAPGRKPEDAPYQGKRIREIEGPKGYTILYGENADANDYLTTRVAKPDDLWLHVRGNVSAHVIIRTERKPDKVPHEVVLHAATIAVRNSSQKHASYVPVDITLRKYVRKPRGAAVGTVLYERERTVHIEKS